jgi:CheY-like chemotaxis protein
MKPFILFVEDDPNDILMMKRALADARLRFRYEFVRDGSIAIAWLAGQGPYDDQDLFPLPNVVVTDLKMADQGGFALLRFIKTQPRLSRIPVIVHSGSMLGADIERARNLGACEYIVKDSAFKGLAQSLAVYDGPQLLTLRAA